MWISTTDNCLAMCLQLKQAKFIRWCGTVWARKRNEEKQKSWPEERYDAVCFEFVRQWGNVPESPPSLMQACWFGESGRLQIAQFGSSLHLIWLITKLSLKLSCTQSHIVSSNTQMAQDSGLRSDGEKRAAEMNILISQHRQFEFLHGGCYLATPKKRGKQRRKEIGRRPETFSWVTGRYRNTPSGGVNKWERGRGRWIGTDRQRKGGWNGKEPRKRERERKRGPGRTSSHRTFLSHLALIPILHVPWLPLFLSPETAESRLHCCCCYEFRWIERGAEGGIEQWRWWMITVWAAWIAQQWLCIIKLKTTKQPAQLFYQIFQTPAQCYPNSHTPNITEELRVKYCTWGSMLWPIIVPPEESLTRAEQARWSNCTHDSWASPQPVSAVLWVWVSYDPSSVFSC